MATAAAGRGKQLESRGGCGIVGPETAGRGLGDLLDFGSEAQANGFGTKVR
ncbi:hypothetical protein SAMN04490248_10478 [Salinihabitans flavidus]|uniref:Uncharacterized protein n=1 Tax=Salinihabitans flavidus TaxID=569882 RepID=A0A1H8NZT1_9RHOB|nr:hypothetical protein [Salinihabitans flavidus]SEO35074.1 hypothetical protein SAMN04490248_10478 [Salinihabitans flavidus]